RSQIAALTSDPNLKSQIATSSLSHGGRRKLPVAFTEHGALMVANILNSPRAVAMSVYVILKETPSVTVSGRRTEWNMCPGLEQRRFGASRGASALRPAATGPSEAAMGKPT